MSQIALDKLIRKRKLFLTQDIDQTSSAALVAQLFQLDSEGKEPIELFINCDGGDIEGMFAIYDCMHIIESPVKTISVGQAYSAAAIILASGTPGMRYAMPNAEVMIHQIQLFTTEGSANDISVEVKQTKRDNKRLFEILARHTGQTYAKVYKDCQFDNYMGAAESLKYGIVDHVLAYTKEVPPLKAPKERKKKEVVAEVVIDEVNDILAL